jgi:hypothetical protein
VRLVAMADSSGKASEKTGDCTSPQNIRSSQHTFDLP